MLIMCAAFQNQSTPSVIDSAQGVVISAPTHMALALLAGVETPQYGSTGCFHSIPTVLPERLPNTPAGC